MYNDGRLLFVILSYRRGETTGAPLQAEPGNQPDARRIALAVVKRSRLPVYERTAHALFSCSILYLRAVAVARPGCSCRRRPSIGGMVHDRCVQAAPAAAGGLPSFSLFK